MTTLKTPDIVFVYPQERKEEDLRLEFGCCMKKMEWKIRLLLPHGWSEKEIYALHKRWVSWKPSETAAFTLEIASGPSARVP